VSPQATCSAARRVSKIALSAQGTVRDPEELRDFLRHRCFDEETGFFHDIWAGGPSGAAQLAYDGIGRWWLARRRPTVGSGDRREPASAGPALRRASDHHGGEERPAFELRMWRGPAWNSMTSWASTRLPARSRAARPAGSWRPPLTGRPGSTTPPARSGVLSPEGRRRTRCSESPTPTAMFPVRTTSEHNPLFAMARMWEAVRPPGSPSASRRPEAAIPLAPSLRASREGDPARRRAHGA